MLKQTTIIFVRNDFGQFVNNPPVGAGDYQISLDGAAFANLANLPTVIAGTPVIRVTLSATEMAASDAVIRGISQTTAWAANYTEVQTEVPSVADIRADIERPTGTLASLNQSSGDATQDLQQAIAVVDNKLPANTAAQIALIAAMRGTDDAFKNGDNIKVTVDGVERTGLHEKV